MAWVRIDDGFAEHPKMEAAGPLAMALQVAALCYCNRNLTDGYVPAAKARRLVDLDSAQDVIQALIDAGVWEEVAGGYQLHDYDEYQPSKADVDAEREAARERMRKARERKATKRSEDVRPNNRRSSGNPDPDPDPNPEPLDPGSGNTSRPTSGDVAHDADPFPEPVEHLTRHLATRIAANGHKLPQRGTKAHHNWFLAIDRLIRLDNAEPDEIEAAIDFATEPDGFWAANIRSAPKFREQYSQLRAQMRRSNPARASPNGTQSAGRQLADAARSGEYQRALRDQAQRLRDQEHPP